jgi:type I restriction enzyme S subunit
MGDEWQARSLNEIYMFSSGLSKPRSSFGSGYPFLSFKDVFDNTFVPRELTELVQSTDREREICSIGRGDVFLTRTSETQDELGMSSVALEDIPNATFNGFTKRLRPRFDTSIVPEFAAYYFRSPAFRRDVSAMSSLSTRASLNNEMLARLHIRFPPPGTQSAISRVLKTLDDKIELTRRMNETLEAMATALFKSWFVDFDPVRAKADGRDPGLPRRIADLFPDRLVDFELGEIPEGWEAQPFTDTVEIIGGGTPKTAVPEYWNGDIPWFSVVDAPIGSEVWVVDTEKKVTREGVENSSTRVLSVGTTIISARGTVGRIALVGVPMAMNQSCYGLRGSAAASAFYTYFLTRELVGSLQQRAHGSVFDTITRDTLASIRVTVPSAKIVEAFESHVDSLLQRIRANVLESRILAALRDTLLPKLISGDLRVKDAERLVAEASA